MVAPPIPQKGRLIKMRLSRAGTKSQPEFFINIAESYRRRDCKFIENLGKFEPIPDSADFSKRIYLNFERVKYWLGRGAQPTYRVAWLLGKANIIPSIPRGMNAVTLSRIITQSLNSFIPASNNSDSVNNAVSVTCSEHKNSSVTNVKDINFSTNPESF